MKAQFATIEAIVALLLVLAALSFARIEINSQNNNAYAARQELVSNIAVYDLLNQLSENASAMNCIESYSIGNMSCMSSYSAYYKSLYRLDSFNIVLVGDGTIVNTNTTKCFPYKLEFGYEELCIEAD